MVNGRRSPCSPLGFLLEQVDEHHRVERRRHRRLRHEAGAGPLMSSIRASVEASGRRPSLSRTVFGTVI